MKRTFFLVALALSGLAFSQTRVWDNVRSNATNSYGPSGPTGVYLGQPAATSWTRWPERGSGINFGSTQTLTEMTVYYLCNNSSVGLTNENMTVQIYANDGPLLTGDLGGSFNSPGTLLFTSAAIPVAAGDQCARVALPNLAVPAKITFTLKFQGGVFDTGCLDPTLNFNLAGGRFWGSVPAANVQGTTGNAMRRVFTSGGPSTFIVQERPATFPATIPFCFAADFMSGNTSLITTPYDNGTNPVGQGGFLPLGDPNGPTAPLAAAGNLMTFEGPNRKVTSIDFGYYADTAASSGSPTFNLKLVKQNATGMFGAGQPGGTPDETQVIWDSGPQAIPLGQGGGGSGALQNVTLPVPNVVVPDNCYWIMTTTGLNGNMDDVAGPGVIWGAIPGNCPNTFSGKDATGAWAGYVFGTGTGTFVFTTIAQLGPIVVTAGPASSFETLAPTAETINLGKGSAGNLASWAGDDANARRICKFIVPTLSAPIIRVTLDYTTTKLAPTAIDFIVRAKMVHIGPFKVRSFVQNKTNSTYVQVLPDTTINQTMTTFTGSATGTLTNFVGGGGAMTGRIEIQQTGPAAVTLPCTDFEFANMKVTG